MAETRFTHPEKASLPAYSFTKAHKKIGVEKIPGPGAYSTDYAIAGIQKGAPLTFGKSPRGSIKKMLGPGPGAYSSPDLHSSPHGGSINRARNFGGE
jgi:hypothetical protein